MNKVVRSKIFNVIPPVFNNSLTVLNYHRIDDPSVDGFDTLKINVSATPVEFGRQMDYIQSRYNVITCEYLALCLCGKASLPPSAAIITFDDGYYDNLSNAYPILKARSLPAVIFLATDFMGSNRSFYWDFVAYCFAHTQKDHADLPVTGACQWTSDEKRDQVMIDWIEAVKKIPELDKTRAVEQIDRILDVSVPDNAFSNLFLTWDQVRELSSNGIEFGAHTASHPILTRIPLEQARDEVVRSKKKIEEETGKKVISLAYPNGGAADFSSDVVRVVRESGFEIAFSLLSGPTFYQTIRKHPFSIRRIFLGYTDTFERFVLKLSGAARVMEILGR